jgi:hypothetical protein
MYEKAFKKLFWGYIFIFINLRISGVDILPDSIGYIIILQGIKMLLPNSEHFTMAMKYNYPLIVLSLFSIYQNNIRDGYFTLPQSSLIGTIVGIASTVVSLLLMYNLFVGIKEMCRKNNIIDLSNTADELWNYYWKVLLAVFLAIPIALIPVIGIIYLIVVIIIAIVVNIKILKLFWDISERFNIDKVIN